MTSPDPNPDPTTTPVLGPFKSLVNLAPDPFQRPLSPWAERYGHTQDLFLHHRDDFLHSTMAPEYPRLDPRYYADNPSDDEYFRGFVWGFEEDRLFCSEYWQNILLKIHTWQVGPLNRYVSFGPRFPKVLGGHSRVGGADDPSSVIDPVRRLSGVTYATNDEALMAVFQSERIKVDESKWFRFFRRSRWWDPEHRDESALGLQWSVDDPKVWEQLRIVLELANRMLSALIDDEHDWLRTLLFGRMDLWANVHDDPPEPDSRVLLSQAEDRLACAALNTQSFFDLHPELPDWRFKLETLLSEAKWTFKDDPGSGVMGTTDPELGGLIAIDVTFFRLLCTDKITLSERCLITIIVTTTVLHELMHHIHFKRLVDDTPDMNNFLTDNKKSWLEPFVDYDGDAEIGAAFEKAVFGGVIEDWPSFGLPVTVLYKTWPGARGGPRLNLKHPAFSPTHQIKTWRVPSTWASTLLSSSFWDDATVPRKSDNRFHCTPLFVSFTANEDFAPRPWGRVKVDRNILDTSTLEKELIKEWDERTALWGTFRRHWHRQGRQRWLTTPVSDTALRAALHNFSRDFSKSDAVYCARQAQILAKALAWDKGRDEFFARVPPADSISWVWSAIGLLMLAACPMQKSYLRRDPTESVRLTGGNVTPSVFAQGVDSENQVIKKRLIMNRTKKIMLPPLLLQNHFRGDPGPVASVQIDYLNMASELVEYFMRIECTLCGPWLFEILRCGKVLLEERRQLRAQYPTDHHTKWARKWDFRVPEYESLNMRGGPSNSIWVVWDEDRNEWADVPEVPVS
ncbi:hypothetical protein F4803DRAFT_517354 [Xylaria telfairii]|nr:hypothetical protein F4803DRAFT_517354 [Xylaria telfairii]